MSRTSVFSSPLLLGFENIERMLDRVAKTAADGYPPYNIERLSDEKTGDILRITLAVAGFTIDELDISVEERQLTIRGKQEDDDDGRIFLHRGIAARQFQRSFVLADGIEVLGADLKDGLLAVDLVRPMPERVVKKISINHAP
jgi:HSP20 family molecular chaperone IbpA